jgi:Icc-related predicted phosphoesterase
LGLKLGFPTPLVDGNGFSCRVGMETRENSAISLPNVSEAQSQPVRTSMTVVRLAALGDLHCTRTSEGAFQPLFAQITESADLVVLAGDLTHHGRPDEASVLARELAALRLPAVAVLGNHDFESDLQDEVRKIVEGAGVIVLDGDACERVGIGIAGIKGFAGGFGRHALGAWGEPMMKQFVQETVSEALKLESALASLRSVQRIALMHYSPVQQTVEGEPPEIYPFVGSSRLEEPLTRYPVTMVFHGHAHRGQPEGATSNGVPVFNVSLPLLARTFPDRPPFRLVHLPLERAESQIARAGI